MESTISNFCRSLASFCNHVQISSQSLSESIQRRPLHFDSSASSFVQNLDRRISSTGADLNLLESMAFGTVSVEELLGHCNEVYKTNTTYISLLEDRMRDLGYAPELGLEGEGEGEDEFDMEVDSDTLSPENGLDGPPLSRAPVAAARPSRKELEEDPLFEESISLQNLGLSDACLATLASEGNDYPTSPAMYSQRGMGQTHGKKLLFEPPNNVLDALDTTFGSATKTMEASKNDYDNLPSYMKSLASWEELQEAVVKMNSYLHKKDENMGNDILNQDDLEKLGLGCKGKSYLLLLIRMNQLVVETNDGSIFYRIRA